MNTQFITPTPSKTMALQTINKLNRAQGREMITNDDDLKRRIVNFLGQRQIPALRHVEVTVDEGTVVIQGKVSSFYEKQLCLNCCQRVAGVVSIDDQVMVA